MRDLYIIGSGGFSKQVIEIVELINNKKKTYKLAGLIDDDESLAGSKVLGYPVKGTTNYLNDLSKEHKVYGVIAIADGCIRKQIADKLKSVFWVNLIHPDTVVSKYTTLGHGNVISGGVVINPECIIGEHCHINIGTTLGHDVYVNNYVTIMPGSRLSGNVTIKSNAMIGTGSAVIQGITIGKNAILGAGTVLVNNAAENCLYIGIPGRKLKSL